MSHSYDLAGNRLTVSKNGRTTERWTHDAADQVAGWTYDAAWYLLDEGRQTYTWDGLGRLAGARTGGATAWAGVIRAVPLLPREAAAMDAPPGGDAARLNARALDRAERALAARAGARTALLGHRPPTRTTVEDREIALLHAVEEEDTPALIAVGTRGTGTAGQLWLGSVAIRVLTCASCSVLIYPHRAVEPR